MDKKDNFFFRLLSQRFDVRICDKPDFLFHSDCGSLHRIHSCANIYFTIECHAPDFTKSDYGFTCRYLDDPRHTRLPIYVHYCIGGAESLLKDPAKIPGVLAAKSGFCCLLTSNIATPTTRTRTEFFRKLCRYKKVDSGGGALNNIGCRIPFDQKRDFVSRYKFSIAFENASVPGYTTEKLFEAMQAKGVPVYWGNPLVEREFNPGSFLNYHDFPSEEALIEKIIELDQDDAKYLEVSQPTVLSRQPAKRGL